MIMSLCSLRAQIFHGTIRHSWTVLLTRISICLRPYRASVSTQECEILQRTVKIALDMRPYDFDLLTLLSQDPLTRKVVCCLLFPTYKIALETWDFAICQKRRSILEGASFSPNGWNLDFFLLAITNFSISSQHTIFTRAAGSSYVCWKKLHAHFCVLLLSEKNNQTRSCEFDCESV